MKVLVTGGAGFMGAHVASELLDRGYEVVVLDDLSGGFIGNVDERAVFVRGSILDHELVDSLFLEHRFSHVFHLAAYAAEGLSHFIRRFNYQNNTVGSVNLINAAVQHRVECFVFTSSIAVYGGAPPPMVETMTPRPEDPYGIAKYAVELDLMAAHEMFGLNYVIFRPHNVYGEKQNIGDRYRNVVGIFMNQILHGMPMTIFGDGGQTRAFTHVADVTPTLVDAAFEPSCYNEVFNLGSSRPRTVLELAHIVADAFGVEAQIDPQPARREVVHAHADHRKIRDLLGFQASTTLEEGVARMAEWAGTLGPRLGRDFAALELHEGLPRSWRPSDAA